MTKINFPQYPIVGIVLGSEAKARFTEFSLYSEGPPPTRSPEPRPGTLGGT